MHRTIPKKGMVINMKILAIGNSFSDDATGWLHQIAKAGGIDLNAVSLCIGGCPLSLHWTNALNDERAYFVSVNGEGTGEFLSISQALQSDSYDFVTFQQGSILSGKPESYYPYIENLFHFVKAVSPDSEILVHQTWAYEPGYERLSEYENSSDVMFRCVKEAYALAAERLAELSNAPSRIIPCGEAMQLARADPLFATVFGDGNPLSLNRDGFHASLEYGRYLLGAVWYEVFTGRGIFKNSFKPEGTRDDVIAVLKQLAHQAVMGYK